MLRLWLMAFAIGGLVGVAPQVRANEAKELFDKGTQLYESGDYPLAADTFREANRVRPNWRILFNIGQCEALAKRHGLALQAFEAYLSKGGDDIAVQRENEVRQEIKRLQYMTGLLDIKAPAGAVVTIDDVERGTAPIVGQIPVSASVEHLVSISFEDGKVEQQAVKVVGGQTVVVRFTPDPALQKPNAPEPIVPLRSSSPPQAVPNPVSLTHLRKAGRFTLALSGGFWVAGMVTGIVSTSKYNTLKERCPDKDCFGESDHALKEEVDSLALTTDILLPIGAALTLTGIVLLVVDKKRRVEEVSVQRKKMHFEPTAGGMIFGGSF